MSDSTPRLGLPDLPDTPELYADTVADAFGRLDAFTGLYLKGQFVNTPPSSPADGDAYLTGGSPTGAWSGTPYKIAACRDGGWEKYAPFNGLRAFVADTGIFIIYQDGAWLDCNSLIGTAEESIAAAAICDIGAAGSLCLQVTGVTAIGGFGAATHKLRFLRFAGSLTLTHNATSLILPSGADLVTATGDTALFTSDADGNWRCRQYSRASGQPVATALAADSFSPLGGGFAAGKLYYSPDDGVVLSGKTGVTNDLVLRGNSGANILSVPTGTADAVFPSRIGIGALPFSPLTIGSDGVTTDTVYLINTHAGGRHWKFGPGTGGHSFGFYQASDGIIAGGFGSDGSFLVGTTINAGAGAIAANYLAPKLFTFASLPASPPNGARAMISDGSVTGFRAIAAGGGGDVVPVHYVSGTGWLVG